MKLTMKQRESGAKCAVKQMRRGGDIPAVLYSSSASAQMIAVDAVEFSALLRQIKSGRLPTTVFALHAGNKQHRALIKEVQYHPTTYRPIHIDFEELHDNVPVSVKVPISCTGIVNCVGIKLGGFLRQVVRHVKVECLPKHIPGEFVLDVKDLGVNQSLSLAEVAMPTGVKPLIAADQVLVLIAKK
jgi:ribosomal protein L25, Ctc-form